MSPRHIDLLDPAHGAAQTTYTNLREVHDDPGASPWLRGMARHYFEEHATSIRVTNPSLVGKPTRRPTLSRTSTWADEPTVVTVHPVAPNIPATLRALCHIENQLRITGLGTTADKVRATYVALSHARVDLLEYLEPVPGISTPSIARALTAVGQRGTGPDDEPKERNLPDDG